MQSPKDRADLSVLPRRSIPLIFGICVVGMTTGTPQPSSRVPIGHGIAGPFQGMPFLFRSVRDRELPEDCVLRRENFVIAEHHDRTAFGASFWRRLHRRVPKLPVHESAAELHASPSWPPERSRSSSAGALFVSFGYTVPRRHEDPAKN